MNKSVIRFLMGKVLKTEAVLNIQGNGRLLLPFHTCPMLAFRLFVMPQKTEKLCVLFKGRLYNNCP